MVLIIELTPKVSKTFNEFDSYSTNRDDNSLTDQYDTCISNSTITDNISNYSHEIPQHVKNRSPIRENMSKTSARSGILNYSCKAGKIPLSSEDFYNIINLSDDRNDNNKSPSERCACRRIDDRTYIDKPVAKTLELHDGFSKSKNNQDARLYNQANSSSFINTTKLNSHLNCNSTDPHKNHNTSGDTFYCKNRLVDINHFVFPSEVYAAKCEGRLEELLDQKRECVFLPQYKSCKEIEALAAARKKREKGRQLTQTIVQLATCFRHKIINFRPTAKCVYCEPGAIIENGYLTEERIEPFTSLDAYDQLLFKEKILLYSKSFFGTRFGFLISVCFLGTICCYTPVAFLIYHVSAQSQESFNSGRGNLIFEGERKEDQVIVNKWDQLWFLIPLVSVGSIFAFGFLVIIKWCNNKIRQHAFQSNEFKEFFSPEPCTNQSCQYDAELCESYELHDVKL